MNRKLLKSFLPLLIGSSILFLIGLSRLPFLGSDEPRYAEVAREMLQSRDFFIPRLAAFPWFEKPVLLYWLMDGSYSLFGVNEFAARLPSVLAAVATVFLISLLITRMRGAEFGIAAGTILATTVLFAAYAHAAMFDMLLTFCITAVFVSFCFYEFEQKSAWLYAMYFFLGLGVLAKGFVALILTVPPIVGCTVFRKNPRSLSHLHPFCGILITIATVSLWFIPISLIYGTEFWSQFFIEQQLRRYTSEYYHHAASIFYYGVILVAGTFPWTFAPFLAASADQLAIRFVRRLSVWWLITTVVFFSLSVTKLPGYVLPAFPPFAILSALSLAAYLESTNRRILPFLLFIITNFVCVVALYWFVQRSFASSGVLKLGLAVLTLLLALVSFLLFRKKLRPVLLLNSSVSLLLLCLFVYRIAPDVRWSDSKRLALDVLPQLSKSRELISYNIDDYAPLFYTKGEMQLTPDGRLYELLDADQLDRYLIRNQRAWLLIDNEDLPWISKSSDWTLEKDYAGKGISIVELKTKQNR